LWYWDFNSEPWPWATPPTLYCEEFFQNTVSQTICPGWLQTMILLISASWVARIIGLSHQHLADWQFWWQDKPMLPTSLKPSAGIWWGSDCFDVERQYQWESILSLL
jgi:hypothetical protein